MKLRNPLFHATLTLALSASLWSQTQTASNAAPAPANPAAPAAAPAQPAVTAADVQALKDALAAQQLEIEALREQLQRKAQIDAVAPPAEPSQPRATEQVAEVNSSSSIQQESAPASAQGATQNDNLQTFSKEMEGPLTLHFRGINITPGGYAEAAFVRRSRALGADLPTPFNSVTMPGASQSQIPEFFGSARQSKITTFVEGRLKNVDLSSYVSADFLSAGVTSTSTQTNGYTLRLRQAWAQAKFDNGWSFLGGQEWSLVTENGKGISPDDDLGRTNDARPKTIDPSYNVGFVFARQYGIRIAKNFGDKVAFAVALENPQATLTSHGNAVVDNEGNFLVGEFGASNSYNTGATYSFNPSPDLIAKVAFDPGFGHYEVFGLIDRFTDRVFPCVENYASAACGTLTAPSAVQAHNASKEGGAFGASARWNIAHHVTFGLKGFGGGGVGRYGPGGLADISINPDGTIHVVKNLIGLGTLEFHTKKLDIYGYGGTEYAARTWGYDSTVLAGATSPVGDVGYGAPGFNNTGCLTEVAPGSGGFSPGTLSKCTADTRALIEGTVGFWYRFYNGPRGRFQFGTQYSYVTRNAWSGYGGLTQPATTGVEPHGLDGMVFTSFRYILP
jgi:hypothetical protein